jgi:hypothetical protein
VLEAMNTELKKNYQRYLMYYAHNKYLSLNGLCTCISFEVPLVSSQRNNKKYVSYLYLGGRQYILYLVMYAQNA